MNIKGGLFIAIGMLVLAIGDNYIRFITDKIGLWQFHFMRSLIAIPLLILFSFNQNYKIIFPKKFKPYIIGKVTNGKNKFWLKKYLK